MKKKNLLAIVLFFLLLPFGLTYAQDTNCEDIYYNEKFSFCDCANVKTFKERVDCVEALQLQIYQDMTDPTSNKYKAEDKSLGFTDLGFRQWGDAEMAYINTLDFGNAEMDPTTRIIFRQDIFQIGNNLFGIRGLLMGSPSNDYLIDLIDKHQGRLQQMGVFIDTDYIRNLEEPTKANSELAQNKERAYLIKNGLEAILDAQLLEIGSLELDAAQLAWKELQANNYRNMED